MGLDLVEYVIAIEEAFEIDIPDADAVHLETPAKLIDYLCDRLGESADGPPLVQTAFYWLRKGLADELALPRGRIRPDSVISELTDRPENDVWRAVAARLEVNPKFLTHSPVVKWLANWCVGQDEAWETSPNSWRCSIRPLSSAKAKDGHGLR